SSARPTSARIRAKTSMASATGGLTSGVVRTFDRLGRSAGGRSTSKPRPRRGSSFSLSSTKTHYVYQSRLVLVCQLGGARFEVALLGEARRSACRSLVATARSCWVAGQLDNGHWILR